tara:strand:+ start:46 stop:159 length:114 start_codon:yes stop_codon:yes gene_type:complete
VDDCVVVVCGAVVLFGDGAVDLDVVSLVDDVGSVLED